MKSQQKPPSRVVWPGKQEGHKYDGNRQGYGLEDRMLARNLRANGGNVDNGCKAERRDWRVAAIMNKAYVKKMTKALRFVHIAWRKSTCE